MLVFTRRRNEAIIVADGITIRVLRISKDGVRLGVTAPPSVPVHRQEIYDQIREENRRAAGPAELPAGLAHLVRATDGAS
ncbi:MAG: carbon storage regulator CsrA [Acidobacteria bacterium]|nr:carbon storage regulator CsrA [Acidobacteriota bacterium]